MSIMRKFSIVDKVKLKPVTLDDLASVRYVHKSAFTLLAGTEHSEEQVQAQNELIYSKNYCDHIFANNTYCAWMGNELIGTSGWCPADDRGGTARVNMIYVHPLFHMLGIGRMMVKNAEERARDAGFYEFSLRANINAVRFYKRLGYHVSSRGILQTPKKVDLPVAFMRKHNIATTHHIYKRSTEQFAYHTA